MRPSITRAAIAILLGITLLLGACGDDDGSGTTDSGLDASGHDALINDAAADDATADDVAADDATADDATADDAAADDATADDATADDATADDATADDATADDATADDATAQKTPCGDQGLECNTADQICVVKVAQLQDYVCEPVPTGCETDRTCACVGASVCTGIFSICTDNAADNTVDCNCPNC